MTFEHREFGGTVSESPEKEQIESPGEMQLRTLHEEIDLQLGWALDELSSRFAHGAVSDSETGSKIQAIREQVRLPGETTIDRLIEEMTDLQRHLIQSAGISGLGVEPAIADFINQLKALSTSRRNYKSANVG